ncbi:MAG: TonB-dependent receptor plug domain-containing protein [Longimicrobiaceae bacterium]
MVIRSGVLKGALRGGIRAATALLSLALPLAAQDPVPPDTTEPAPPDTAVFEIPADALPKDTLPDPELEPAPDSLLPAPQLPAFGSPGPSGRELGVWVWDQEALDRFHGLSLLDLLDRVPGLRIVRGGYPGQPAGVAAGGWAGGRVRVFLDGFELDPLSSATPDLQRLALADLDHLRVEVTPLEVRLELQSFQPTDRRPNSRLEIGTGDFDTRLLRALFGRPFGDDHALFVAYDLVDTQGPLGAQPFAGSTGIVRWTWAPDSVFGVRLEYRGSRYEQPAANFDTVQAVAESGERADLILRGRYAPPDGPLRADLILGTTRLSSTAADFGRLADRGWQGALRARLGHDALWVEGRARGHRRGAGYPVTELEAGASAGLSRGGWLHASGELSFARAGGVGGARLAGRARLSPLPLVSIFAQGAAGSRGIGFSRDSTYTLQGYDLRLLEDGFLQVTPTARDTTVIFFPVAGSTGWGVRAGAELRLLGGRVGGGWLADQTDSSFPFGLTFDRVEPPLEAGPVTGVEAYLDLPLFTPSLRLSASVLGWTPGGERPYLPEYDWNAALEFHDVFYTGNLEPTVRLEVAGRGKMRVPGPEPGFTALSEPYVWTRGFVQIRVVDVRAFVLVENILAIRGLADLPGRPFSPIPHSVFGIRWHFLN